MELAGLALAIYPATVLAFEQYKKGARYISDWARYRRKYEAFIRDMEGQQLFFEGIIQDLLCGGSDPFLTGDSGQSKDSFLRIATDASFTGWKNPVLKQRLKARLYSRYDWCMYTIKRIYDIMIELGELLDIQALESSNKTPDWWRFQWQRIIQTLFAEGGYEDHKVAKRLIEELRQMIELSDKQRTQGGFQQLSKLAPFFRATRENANTLHEALRSSWKCCCNASHRIMLQLERKIERGEDEFNILCVLPSTDSQAQTQKARDRVKRDVHVMASRKEISVSEPVSQPVTSPTPSQQRIDPSPTQAPPSAPTKEPLSHPIARNTTTSTNKSKSGGFRVQVSELSSSLRHKIRRKPSVKGKEVRRFDVVASMQAERIDEELNLKAAPLFQDLVAPVDTSKTEVPPPPSESDLITDLCEALNKECTDASLGYLDYRDYTYDFLGNPLSDAEGSTTTTLNELLEANARQPYEFPAEKRAIVATILASSLLQLQKTHWIGENWTRRDIFFTTYGSKVDFSKPYLSQDFVSTKARTGSQPDVSSTNGSAPPTKTETVTSVSRSLFAPKSFDPKRSLECLGILLIELCFGVPIERWQDKVRLRPTSPGSYNHEFNLAIANAWTWEEIRTHDPLFSDPINSCLHFPHRRGIDEIVDDMYELIAKPLYEETRRKWPPLSEVETY